MSADFKKKYAVLLFFILIFTGILSSCGVLDGDFEYALVSKGQISSDGYIYDLYENGEAMIVGINDANENSRLIIPEKVESHTVFAIGEGAFAENIGVKYVSLPDSVRRIGANAFKDCEMLLRVKLGKKTARIGDYAFANCSSLTEVSGGDSVSEIGSCAFQSCVSLCCISFSDRLSIIGNSAFSGCTALTELKIPSKAAVTIYNEAFFGCSSLCRLELGGTVKLCDGAFLKCQSVVMAELPQSLEYVGNGAFRNCSSLEEVTASKALNTVGAGAFSGTPWYEANEDEFMMIGNGILLKYNGNGQNVIVPKDVRVIADAFSGNCNIKSVTVPDNAKTSDISSGAFSGCSALAKVTIGKSVVHLGEGAFSGCGMLASVYIGNGIKTIDKNAFFGCTSLAVVNYAGTQKDFSGIKIATGNSPLTNARVGFSQKAE